MKKIVITGATSSIGCALIDECIKQNMDVLAIANPGSLNLKNIPVSERVTVAECALSDFGSWDISQYGQDWDAFIHLAWASTAGDAARNQLQPQVKNIEYALDAVELAQRLGCEAFVGSGSQAEYGRTDAILTEETPTFPETAYGMAKLCAGQMTRLACAKRGIRHIWPRILSAYGPKCQPQTVINYTLTELLAGRRPSLSPCEQIWDFIYTGDVAKALLLLAERGRDGEIYVIGSGESHPLKEYIIKARDIINPKSELGFGEKTLSPSAVMHLACDISKLKRDTGFEVSVEFEEGIRRTIETL